jgi:hypothetical protein
MSKRVQNPLLGKTTYIVLFDLEIPGTPEKSKLSGRSKILLGTFFNNIISMIKQRQ